MLLPSELLIIIRQLQCIHAYETREWNWPSHSQTQKEVKPKTCSMNMEARHTATLPLACCHQKLSIIHTPVCVSQVGLMVVPW